MDPCNTVNDAAIVRTITGLGAILGIRTTAQGVETAEQLAQMRSQGCTEVQGFLLGRPVAEKELSAVITAFANGAGISSGSGLSTSSKIGGAP